MGSRTLTDRPDLMHQDDVRDLVATAYAALPRGAGQAVAADLYVEEDLTWLPHVAVDWALGVGDPVRHAGLEEGQVVLDLGCGGGIDALLAARAVGAGCRVIGLDLLDQMCRRAAQAAAAAGLADRCAFVPGAMEAIPLADDSVDVVIANGSLNLSPRKRRVLAEVGRVLRPGGRLCMADLLVATDLPPVVLGSPAAWAGCVAGALSERVLRRALDGLGFTDVIVEPRGPVGVDQLARYPLFDDDTLALLRSAVPAEQQDRLATAVLVRAVGPGAGPVVRPGPRQLGWITGVRSLDQVPPAAVEAPGVVVRQLKQVDDVDLKVLDVEPGGSTPFHTHAHAHEGVVVSGTGWLRLADRRIPLEPGSTFTVNPGDRHAVESDDTGPLRFVCMDCLVG